MIGSHLSKIMGADVQVLTDIMSRDLIRKEEANLIEGKNQDRLNNKKIL